MSLEPDYESFIGLNLLEGLDLSHNNLASMPAGLFCPLVNIVTVNVSHNILVDLEHLGLSHRGDFKCNVSVESLIVTNNGLRTITPGALASLHKLKVLDFSRNEVGVLVEDAFKGLAQLEKLDASHNRLAALPPKIFRFEHTDFNRHGFKLRV
jgi:Leucine-rich repeat (LRR) protein